MMLFFIVYEIHKDFEKRFRNITQPRIGGFGNPKKFQLAFFIFGFV